MEPEYVVATWRKMEPGTREGLLVFTALVVVILTCVLWAVYFRKRRRRHHHHHHAHASTREATVSETDEDPRSHKLRRIRRRRREHRPRNPTLAETGGLPPARTGGPSDASP